MKRIKDKIVGHIYETTNYDQFGDLNGNRDKESKRVKDLIKSIRNKGQLQPIQVNTAMNVLDGQARLEALKFLKLPVQYYIKDAGLEECIEMNNTGKKWSTMAYINSWITNINTPAEVRTEYELLRQCILRYKKSGLSENIIIKICANNMGGGSLIKVVQKGQFRFKRPISVATNLLDYLSGFATVLKRCGRKELVIPILVEAYENCNINNQKFMMRIISNAQKLHGVGSADEARIMFQGAYNYGLKKNLINLLAESTKGEHVS